MPRTTFLTCNTAVYFTHGACHLTFNLPCIRNLTNEGHDLYSTGMSTTNYIESICVIWATQNSS